MIQQAARDGRIARPDSNLELDLGLDSMERVELLTALEQRFGADVPEDEAQRLFTVRELVDAIARHRVSADALEAGDAWSTLLATDPADVPDLSNILEPKSVAAWMLFGTLRLLLWLARLVIRFEVSGLERLPAAGPYLICPNHQSYLDSFVIGGRLPARVFRQLFVVGASEYFGTAITSWLARQVNVVPVDPDASLVPAMQAGAFGLRHGRVLALFPEGERSIDGTVRAFKKGAAILSENLAVPIVPVAIDGAYDLWPRNRAINWHLLRPWRRHRIVIEFGTPLVPAAASPADAARAPRDYTAPTARLRGTVEAMWTRIASTRRSS
jgi:long-chain acyl-CoA synthetase